MARLAPAGQASTATGGALFFTFGGVLIGPSLFAAIYSHLQSYAATFAVGAALGAVGIAFLTRVEKSADPATRLSGVDR